MLLTKLIYIGYEDYEDEHTHTKTHKEKKISLISILDMNIRSLEQTK